MTFTLALAATAALLAFFVLKSWALKGHFLTDGQVAPGMRLIAIVGAVSICWFMWERAQVFTGAATLPAWREGAALLVCLLGLALFLAALAATRRRRLTLAFSDDRPTFLMASGPYAVIRHPFYTSYILFWIAAALQVPAPAYLVVPVGLAVVYWLAASKEEAKFASSTLAESYAQYRRTAGMLFPRLRNGS